MPNRTHVTALEDQVETVVGMKLGEMWDRYLGEFLGEWDRLSRQQLPESEIDSALQSFMDGLSSKPDEKAARTASTVAYNQGRNAETLTQAARGGTQFVIRSEVLDTNTCRPCSLLDGEAFAVGSSEYYANMPPAQCDGGDQCRGFYIPVGAA